MAVAEQELQQGELFEGMALTKFKATISGEIEETPKLTMGERVRLDVEAEVVEVRFKDGTRKQVLQVVAAEIL